MLGRMLVLTTLVSLGIAWMPAAHADDDLELGSLSYSIDTLAESVAKFCKSRKVGVLLVSNFSMPDRALNPQAGSLIKQKMFDSLKKRGIEVSRSLLDGTNPSHRLNGICQIDASSGDIVLRLIVSLFRTDLNTEVTAFQNSVHVVDVTNREELTQTLGLTTDFSVGIAQVNDKTSLEQIHTSVERKITNSITSPSVSISTSSNAPEANRESGSSITQTSAPMPETPSGPGVQQTLISPSTTSKFRIEILVRNQRKEYIPVPATSKNGQAVVELNPKDIYAVRIFNDFDFDLAARVTLDGINSLAMSEVPGYVKLGCWVIPRKSFATVRGWHKTDEFVDEFKVTNYPDSVAKLIGGPAEGIGVIHVQLFPAWKEDEPRPAEEIEGLGLGEPALATGVGERLQTFSEPVQRIFGKALIGAITVRYVRPEQPQGNLALKRPSAQTGP